MVMAYGRKGKGVTGILLDDCDRDLLKHYWKVRSDHYAIRTVANGKRGGRKEWLHRVILERKLGRPIARGMVTDHRNRDRLDNRRQNLREATPSLNGQNRAASRVALGDGSQWWKVYVNVGGRRRFISSLTRTEAQAIAVELDLAIQRGDDLEAFIRQARRPRRGRSDNVAGIRHVSYRQHEDAYRARVLKAGHNHWGPKRATPQESAADAAAIRCGIGIL